MGSYTKWLPTVITLVLTLIGILTPAIQHYLSAHPAASTVLVGIYALIKGLLPSPVVSASATGAAK